MYSLGLIKVHNSVSYHNNILYYDVCVRSVYIC